jgi:hypothetical protein
LRWSHPNCIAIDGDGIGTTTDTFEETYPVTTGTRFGIQNRNGSIHIVPVDGDSIVVRAVNRTSYGKSEFDKIRIDVTMGDPFTVVTTMLREPARVSVDYELRIPRFMLVRTADTTNGSIEVTGVKGVMELHSSNGSVTSTNGTIDARLPRSTGPPSTFTRPTATLPSG